MIAKCVLQATNRMKLLIPRSSIQAHGGDLWAESKVGESAMFYFILSVQPGNSSNGGNHDKPMTLLGNEYF